MQDVTSAGVLHFTALVYPPSPEPEDAKRTVHYSYAGPFQQRGRQHTYVRLHCMESASTVRHDATRHDYSTSQRSDVVVNAQAKPSQGRQTKRVYGGGGDEGSRNQNERTRTVWGMGTAYVRYLMSYVRDDAICRAHPQPPQMRGRGLPVRVECPCPWFVSTMRLCCSNGR